MSQRVPSADPLDDAGLDRLFREAHTAYGFDDEPVSDEQLVAIYELTKLGPTAMNSQPLRVAYVRSREAKQRLMPHLAEGNRAKSESAPAVAILAADTDFHRHLERVAPHQRGARERYDGDVEARVQAALFNATLQAGYFIMAARAMGLDAGPMGGFDRQGIDGEFFGATALRSILVVNLGYVAEGGQRPRSPRLEPEEAVSMW